jgi:hypothetical protein
MTSALLSNVDLQIANLLKAAGSSVTPGDPAEQTPPASFHPGKSVPTSTRKPQSRAPSFTPAKPPTHIKDQDLDAFIRSLLAGPKQEQAVTPAVEAKAAPPATTEETKTEPETSPKPGPEAPPPTDLEQKPETEEQGESAQQRGKKRAKTAAP